MCLAHSAFPSHTAYSFLFDVKDRFVRKYGEQAQKAIGLSAREFGPELTDRLSYFNQPEADRVRTARTHLEATRQIMVKNLDSILSRGESIEILVEKTSLMMEEAVDMRKTGGKVKRHFWWKNFRLSLILFGVLLVIVFVAIWALCGMPSFQDCR